jgi:hypothetical protein
MNVLGCRGSHRHLSSGASDPSSPSFCLCLSLCLFSNPQSPLVRLTDLLTLAVTHPFPQMRTLKDTQSHTHSLSHWSSPWSLLPHTVQQRKPPLSSGGEQSSQHPETAPGLGVLNYLAVVTESPDLQTLPTLSLFIHYQCDPWQNLKACLSGNEDMNTQVQMKL